MRLDLKKQVQRDTEEWKKRNTPAAVPLMSRFTTRLKQPVTIFPGLFAPPAHHSFTRLYPEAECTVSNLLNYSTSKWVKLDT